VPEKIATENLVIALSHVTHFKRACDVHDATAVFGVIGEYSGVFAKSIKPAKGRIIKLIGDAILMTFPARQAGKALAALKDAQAEADRLLKSFDAECRVQIKVTAGRLACGMLGPPGDERYDVMGDPLNRLFLTPWADFAVSQSASELAKA
jgi:class 3 adenylate cyclase